MEWRLNRHLGSSSEVKTDPEHNYDLSETTCKNLAQIGQVVPEILKNLQNPRWRLCRHFGYSSKVKTHRKQIHSLSATTCKIW